MQARPLHCFCIITTILGMLSLPLTTLSAEVRTHIDNPNISVDESFTVTFTALQPKSSTPPDFSPLEKDFIILGTHESIEVQLINGRSANSKSWTLVLLPRAAGDFKIPSLLIGDTHSQPITVRISNIPSGQNSNQQETQPDAFMSVDVHPTDPYVQSEVLYTLRLYSVNRLVNGAIVEPMSDHALIVRLGNDTQEIEEVEGRVYQVLERRYAIFPEKSGPLELSAPIFTGVRQDNIYNRLDPWFNRMGSAIRLRAPAITLEVKPVPPAFQGEDWLPAHELSLQDHWPKATIHAGEPLTRTITMFAQGSTAAHLPSLPTADIATVNIYSDQKQNQNQIEDAHLIAERIEDVTYIPTQPGNITIPRIVIPWWNTQTNTMEIAELPAVTLQVLPTTGSVQQGTTNERLADNTPPQTSIEKAPSSASSAEVISTNINAANKQSNTSYPWITIIIALLSGMALVVLALLLWRYRHMIRLNTSPQTPPHNDCLSLRAIRRKLKHACLKGDSVAAHTLLLKWSKMRWPAQQAHNLTALAARIADKSLARVLTNLQAARYAANPQPWDGTYFWKIFKASEKNIEKHTGQKPPSLPPLYLYNEDDKAH